MIDDQHQLPIEVYSQMQELSERALLRTYELTQVFIDVTMSNASNISLGGAATLYIVNKVLDRINAKKNTFNKSTHAALLPALDAPAASVAKKSALVNLSLFSAKVATPEEKVVTPAPRARSS